MDIAYFYRHFKNISLNSDDKYTKDEVKKANFILNTLRGAIETSEND